MSSGRVFVGEDFDDEPGFLSARFSAHWESDNVDVGRVDSWTKQSSVRGQPGYGYTTK